VAHLLLTQAHRTGLDLVETPRPGFLIAGELYVVRLKEHTTRFNTPVERPGSAALYRQFTRAVPSGRLELSLDGRVALPRMRWTDGRSPLEDQLPAVITALVAAIPLVQVQQAEDRERERQAQLRADQARRERERAQVEQANRTALIDQAEAWQRSGVLDAYLDAAERRLASELESDSPAARWLA
jgi:FtsZ-binding cell division protein ZapB